MGAPRLIKFVTTLALTAGTLTTTALANEPLRLPNGVYRYSLFDGKGPPAFTSVIHVRGTGSTFSVSETVKLPGGQIATTDSVWSGATLLPKTFDVHQGKIRLHAVIDRDELTLTGRARPFLRISQSTAILPSVGLISTTLLTAYFLLAHPGDAVTLAELQNNQTVIIRRGSSPAIPAGQARHTAVVLMKQEKHGVAGDLERLVGALDRRTGIIDGIIATPGTARIVLDQYSPGAH